MFLRYDIYGLEDLMSSGCDLLRRIDAGPITRQANTAYATRVLRDATYNQYSTNSSRVLLANLAVMLVRAAVFKSELEGREVYVTTSTPPSTHYVLGTQEGYTVAVAPPSGRLPSNSRRWTVPAYAYRMVASEGETRTAAPDGLVIERDSNLFIMRPNDELLETIPAGARNFANRVALEAASGTSVEVFEINSETNASLGRRSLSNGGTPTGGYPDPQALLTEARASYREWLRLSMGRTSIDQEEMARQRERREQAARRYEAFAARPADETRHVPTLPFVPHGLSSSRRWGIEVESGGARGVEAPADWRRIGDGSLRSAWDGYVEVQDFEPHDEIVVDFIRPGLCPVNRDSHNPEERYIDSVTGDYAWRMNPNYISPSDCEHCGNRERTVHVEPQTIRHTAQGGDTAEFVSPILVSMHSNGLATILEQLQKQPQNDSAGVHVHVEADDLSHEQVATLIFGYDVLEPILEASYQREARRYCQRRSPVNALNAARLLRAGNTVSSDDVRGGDRYVTLNTTALNEHGTIEFRAMGPVYDYDYLVRWAMLCRELVNIAKAGVTTKRFSRVKTWDDLLMLLAEYGKEYVRAATYELTGETGQAADLVKQGVPLTNEALNADFNTISQGVGSLPGQVTATWRRLAEAFARRTADDLVSVGDASVNMWMR